MGKIGSAGWTTEELNTEGALRERSIRPDLHVAIVEWTVVLKGIRVGSRRERAGSSVSNT
jgi:hypothetical protein